MAIGKVHQNTHRNRVAVVRGVKDERSDEISACLSVPLAQFSKWSEVTAGFFSGAAIGRYSPLAGPYFMFYTFFCSKTLKYNARIHKNASACGDFVPRPLGLHWGFSVPQTT